MSSVIIICISTRMIVWLIDLADWHVSTVILHWRHYVCARLWAGIREYIIYHNYVLLTGQVPDGVILIKLRNCLPHTISASHGTSSWKSTPVPECPRVSPTFLILPTPSTICTYLGWVLTNLTSHSGSMPQAMGSGGHLQRKCILWICVPECSCDWTSPFSMLIK